MVTKVITPRHTNRHFNSGANAMSMTPEWLPTKIGSGFCLQMTSNACNDS